jgi:hypothetical protein
MTVVAWRERQCYEDDTLPARVLVADDHAPTCELICEILRSAEWKPIL